MKNIIKYFLFSSLIIFTACSRNNKIDIKTNTTPKSLSPKEKIIINDKKNNIIEKDYSKFNQIPTAEQIKISAKLGKFDPFSNSINQEKQLPFPEIELRGIIMTKKESSAIVKYNDKSGEVRIGDVGGITTNLLPNGIKLIKINLPRENVVIMNHDSKKFKLKLHQL